jgi:hypothetical protein
MLRAGDDNSSAGGLKEGIAIIEGQREFRPWATSITASTGSQRTDFGTAQRKHRRHD